MENKALVLILCLVVFMVDCNRQSPKISRVQISQDSLPQQEFFDTTRLSLFEKNRKLWNLTTTHIIRYRQKNTTLIHPVDITYYTADGTSHLLADSGIISSEMDTLKASGNVSISTFDAKRVTTSHIAWYKKSDKVMSDRFVKMVTSEGDVYTGTGFVANTNLTEWKILKNVKARIHNPDKGFAQ